MIAELSLFDTAEPEPSKTILSAQQWNTNGELVDDLRALGYLSGRILDPTYGRGIWWSVWRPDELIVTDLSTGIDFTALPFPAAVFDSAVFDPPHLPSYIVGSSTEQDYRNRYGITTPRNSREIDELYRAGIEEIARVLRPGGFLTVKATDHVNGRVFQTMSSRVDGWIREAGLAVVDVLVMLRNPGPVSNPARTVSRRNYSTATVGRKSLRAPR